MNITVKPLTVRVQSKVLLSRVELNVDAGEWVTIIGPNGAGKSTLLRCIAGLSSHSGTVLLDARDVNRLRPRERAHMLAYLPQRYTDPGALTVRDFVMLGRAPHRSALGGATSADQGAVSDALECMELLGFEDRFLDSLSGGEVQRVRLAQTIVQDTPVLLLDEPTTALDIGRAQHLLDLLSRLRVEKRLTIVLTMHDLSLAGHYADRVVLMAEGAVAAEGTASEVLTVDNISKYYEARVRVLDDAGRVCVLPA